MSNLQTADSYLLGSRHVNRIGYGAMQLAGPGVFGPPKDPETAVKILRTAIENGVNHIDTSDFYGPHYTNQIIRKALHPYANDLVIVTKISAKRGVDGSWLPALSKEEITQAVHDNLQNLGLDVLEVVNFRSMLGIHGPGEGSIEEPLSILAEMQNKGLIKHIGLSNINQKQLEEGRKICPIVCVQNAYNITHRNDDAMIDHLAQEGIPYVPFFPVGGFTPLQSETLNRIAADLGVEPLPLALAWLLKRSPNILLIPGTSSLLHLEQNLAVQDIQFSDDQWLELSGIPPHADH